MSGPDSLFRPEAIAARSYRLYGELKLPSELGNSIAIGALGASAVLLVVLATNLRIARTETVRGMITTSIPAIRVSAPRTGVVIRSDMKEGEAVFAGQVVATIRVETASDSGQYLSSNSLQKMDSQLSAMEHQAKVIDGLLDAENSRVREAEAHAENEKIQVQAQIALQTEVVASAKRLYEIFDTVALDGIVSKLDFERRKQTVLQEEMKLKQLEQLLTQNLTQLAQHRNALSKIPIERAKQHHERLMNVANLSVQRLKTRSEVDYDVIAPADGRITGVNASPGKSTESNKPLFTILPVNSTYQVEIFAPSRSVGFLEKGQDVRILFDSFPVSNFGSFKGKIDEIASVISLPSEIDPSLKMEEAAYRIRVTLDKQAVVTHGSVHGLRSGMTVVATLVLEKRSLLERLLEPLYRAINKI